MTHDEASPDRPRPGGRVDLLGPADIRQLAQQLGLRPTKTWGQNFVIDPGTVRRIVRTAGVRAGEHIVEVGPGLGSLTLGLLEAGARVWAVEIDPKLAEQLPRTVAERAPEHADRLTVVHADALALDQLPGNPVAMVANLPYNVAVPLVLSALATNPQLQRLLVMVQAEVADRMVAGPGSRTYGVPSAKIAYDASAKRAGAIGRSVFWPVPNVDSALVQIDRRPTPNVPRAEVFAAIDAAFAQRRKTLRAALATWAGSPADAERIASAAGVDFRQRGEQLDVTDFARLARARRALDPGASGGSAGTGRKLVT